MLGFEVFCKKVKILKTIPYNLIEVVSSYMCDFDLQYLHGRTSEAIHQIEVSVRICY